MSIRPYIGVSGIASQGQAEEILSIAESYGLLENRDILMGVKATHKTLIDKIENKYSSIWYPIGAGISQALDGKRPRMQGVAQVFMEHPENEEYRNLFTNRLKGYGDHWLTGIQYDMLPWHREDLVPYLDSVRAAGLDVYLQVHREILAMGADVAHEIFSVYRGCVTHLLFDSSHGTGKEMDVSHLIPFIEKFSDGDQRLGVAGGLGGSVAHLNPLLEIYPDLSWDAEGKLHRNEDGSRGINMETVDSYLKSSSETIGNIGFPEKVD